MTEQGKPTMVQKPDETATLVCAGCGARVWGEDYAAAMGLAWLHQQDCQGGDST